MELADQPGVARKLNTVSKIVLSIALCGTHMRVLEVFVLEIFILTFEVPTKSPSLFTRAAQDFGIGRL